MGESEGKRGRYKAKETKGRDMQEMDAKRQRGIVKKERDREERWRGRARREETEMKRQRGEVGANTFCAFALLRSHA
jgi:hypothetical protein